MHDQDDGWRGTGDRAASVQVALLTPAGRGALAVIGVAGRGSTALIDSIFRPRGGATISARPDGSIGFGGWPGPGGGAVEDVVVARIAVDRCDIHCHGGLAASRAILDSLVARGATPVSWEAWLRGACREREGACATEARIAICRAGGPAAARILGRQIAGALDGAFDRIERLLAAGQAQAAIAACDRLLRASRVGLRLTTPWRVAVVGPVNAGKSSLMNRLAGHARSVVSPLPGTTRDLVTSRLVIGGWEIEMIDTAGLREPGAARGVERAGVARALAVQDDVDLLVRVTPADRLATAPPGDVAGRRRDAVQPGPPAVIEVVSKADLVAGRSAASRPHPNAGDAVLTSAVTGLGIDRLADRIVAVLVPEAADPGLLAAAVPFTPAQVTRITRLRAGAGVTPPAPPPSGRGAGA